MVGGPVGVEHVGWDKWFGAWAGAGGLLTGKGGGGDKTELKNSDDTLPLQDDTVAHPLPPPRPRRAQVGALLQGQIGLRVLLLSCPFTRKRIRSTKIHIDNNTSPPPN